MKCSSCWAEKAYLRPISGWQSVLHKCLLRVPLKCHHCYHKFSVSWFSTIGKSLNVPPHLVQVHRVSVPTPTPTRVKERAMAGASGDAMRSGAPRSRAA